MPAEPAEAVERTRDATASRALMQLQPAVGAASLLRMVENHRGLVASGTQARRDQRQRRELHISRSTGVPIGRGAGLLLTGFGTAAGVRLGGRPRAGWWAAKSG